MVCLLQAGAPCGRCLFSLAVFGFCSMFYHCSSNTTGGVIIIHHVLCLRFGRSESDLKIVPTLVCTYVTVHLMHVATQNTPHPFQARTNRLLVRHTCFYSHLYQIAITLYILSSIKSCICFLILSGRTCCPVESNLSCSCLYCVVCPFTNSPHRQIILSHNAQYLQPIYHVPLQNKQFIFFPFLAAVSET